MERPLNVLALASYPEEAAATRYRLSQFVEPMAARGIRLEVRPFLTSDTFARMYRSSEWAATMAGALRVLPRRIADIGRARSADVVFVQREAMMFGPPLVETLAARAGRVPLVLDLDDPTYISYVSPTYGRVAQLLKWPSKTDALIRSARLVTCGNAVIADHVRALGTRALLVPTVVDTKRFCPRAERPAGAGPPVLGWVGTHSTFPFLASLAPVLEELARRHRFRLRIVGSGQRGFDVHGVETEVLDWDLHREVEDFQSIDIGLYPIAENEWSRGKSALKSVQYLAVGVPFVVSPVGAAADIGVAGATHLAARSHEEWLDALGRLIAEPALRQTLGEAGRRYAVEHFDVEPMADRLASAFFEVSGAALNEHERFDRSGTLR
jgi:glycosyltransferase involved in cell wall biosynthesis